MTSFPRAQVPAIGAMALVALLFSAAPTQALCVGDCDGDDLTTRDELASCIEIALGRAQSSTCSSCDADGADGVTVDDVVKGIVDALGPCSALQSEVGAAGASAALNGTLLSSTGIFDIGLLSAGGGGGGGGGGGLRAGQLALLRQSPALGEQNGGAAGSLGCPLGGSVEFTCTRLEDEVFFTAVYAQCGVIDDESRALFYDGDESIRTANPDFCLTGEIPFDTPTEVSAIDLSVLVGTFGGSPYERRSFFDASMGFNLSEDRCQLPAGGFSIEGEVAYDCFGADPGMVSPCGETPYSTHLAFTDFSLEIGPAPIQGVCFDELIANGRVESLLDPFAAEYSAFVEQVLDTSNGTFVFQQGVIQLDCLAAPILLGTREAISTPPGATCPIAGVVELASEGLSGPITVRYTMGGGVELDFDGDEQADQAFSSCEDPALDQCFER